MSSAAHRQTRYQAAPPFAGPDVLPLPAITTDLEQAKADLTEYGMCLVGNVLSPEHLQRLRQALTDQAAAEIALGDVSPHLSADGSADGKIILSNLVNKGHAYLDLLEHPLTDALGATCWANIFCCPA